jgi:AbrB family looped-hinge helix DNA binding protein
MLHSTLTVKGQTTIPSEVRKALNAKAGDKLMYEVAADHVTLRVHPGARSLLGALRSDAGKGKTFKEIRRLAAIARAEQWASKGFGK